MKLFERHLLLQKRPAEFGFVVDESRLGDFLARRLGCEEPSAGGEWAYGNGRTFLGIKFFGDIGIGILEFFEEVRGDGEEVDTAELLDLADLQKHLGEHSLSARSRSEALTFRKEAPMTMVLYPCCL